MKTLEHQLADYGEHQRELHGSISLDELFTAMDKSDQLGRVRPLGALPPSTGLRVRRAWLVAAAAAAAVLILISGAALLLQVPASNSPVATTTP